MAPDRVCVDTTQCYYVLDCLALIATYYENLVPRKYEEAGKKQRQSEIVMNAN